MSLEKICDQPSELQQPVYRAGGTKTKAFQRIQQRRSSSSKNSWNPFKCNAKSEYVGKLHSGRTNLWAVVKYIQQVYMNLTNTPPLVLVELVSTKIWITSCHCGCMFALHCNKPNPTEKVKQREAEHWGIGWGWGYDTGFQNGTKHQ